MRVSETKLLAGFLIVAGAIGMLEWITPAPNHQQQVFVTPEFYQFVAEQSPRNFEQALAATIEEEILYREGLELGLDNNDLIVKRRVIQKMRFLIEASTALESPSAQQLQAWLDDHPDDFMHEASVRFEHRFFARSKNRETTIERANTALASLQSDPHPFNKPQEFVNYNLLVRELGKPVAETLLTLPIGEWSVPLQSGVGFHLFRVIERKPAQQKTIQEAGAPLIAAVEQAQRARMNQAAIDVIKAKYKIIQSPRIDTAMTRVNE